METLIVESLPVILQVVFTLVGLGLIWGLKKLFKSHAENQAISQALEALRVGVDKAQEELVIWAKRDSADGKLTKEERAAARDLAIKHALEIAKGPGLVLLKEFSKDQLASLIARIVEKKKV